MAIGHKEKLQYLQAKMGGLWTRDAQGVDNKYEFCEGHIYKIQETVKENPKDPSKQFHNWNVYFVDGNEKFVLQFNAESFLVINFFSALQKCDWSKAIRVDTWPTKDPEGKGVNLGLSQNGNKVRADWDEVKKQTVFIQPKKVTLNGKNFYDWTEVNQWINDNIVNKLNAQNSTVSVQNHTSEQVAETDEFDESEF
jgi:hypothetical protein